uniref:Glutamyl-tRNA(Gln) amidotransferase subunit B, mitochondrial n=1 Tax=Mesocestoides corti TaxID=53468 RepID=A0A5K3EMY4_MESCO
MMSHLLSPLRRSVAFFASDTSAWVSTIGLEVHAQLTSARSKLFSPACYSFTAPPNTQIAPLDAALPGSMPLLNRACVEWAVVAGLALNCRINPTSRFDRKHYFYADSPAGYQITQHASPIAESGWLDYVWKPSDHEAPPQVSRATIKRIQLEQDTAKSLHDEEGGRSLIDLNRTGVGLIEIVTEPVFSWGCQAAAFVEELSSLLRHLRVCSANMSAGELRVDINVSIGPSKSEQGPIVEVKNVNSLRTIRQAIDFEIARQCEVVQSGGVVVNETRSYDANNNKTTPMRDKEVVQDYRFHPEPDLPLLRIRESCDLCRSLETVGENAVKQSSASALGAKCEGSRGVCVGCVRVAYSLTGADSDLALPNKVRQELVFDHGLPVERAALLINVQQLRDLYQSASSLTVSQLLDFRQDILMRQSFQDDDFNRLIRNEVAYWCSGILYSSLRDKPKFCLPSPTQLSQFVIMNLTGQIFGTGSEEVLNSMCSVGESAHPLEVARQRGVLLVNNREVIRTVCCAFVEANSSLLRRCFDAVKLPDTIFAWTISIVTRNLL